MTGSTRPLDDDPVLRAFFRDDAVGTVPDDLLQRALTRTRSAGRAPAWQRWLWRRGWDGRAQTGRGRLRLVGVLAVVAAIIAATLWFALIPSGTAPTPPGEIEPPTLVERFPVPFTYVANPDIKRFDERKAVTFSTVAWIQGPDGLTVPKSVQRAGGQDEDSHVVHGLVVASAPEPWTHGCEGRDRQTIRASSAEFLADLRDIEGAGLGPFTETTLDGHSAVTATLSVAASRCGTDVHFAPIGQGTVYETYIGLDLPAQFIAVDIGGRTVVIQIWSRDEADLAAWLPVATRFVDQFRFQPTS